MSFPGYPVAPDAGDPQQQQPLFGPQIGNPELQKLQEAIAQQLAQQQPSGPVASPYEALHRAVSPLIGVLMQKHLANKQFEAQQAAMPEIEAAFHSDDPLGALLKSKSPLVQQMALQYMPDWMKAGIQLQSEYHKRQIIDPLDVKKAGDIEAAKEPWAVKQATDIQTATIPLEVQKAIDIAKGTLPIDLAKTRAGQAGTFADLAEKKREFEITQGSGGGMVPGPLGQNPASLYGGKTQ